MRAKLLLSVLPLLSLACATLPRSPATRAELLAADAQFDAEVAAKGIDAWVDWFEEDVATWQHKELVHGRETYRSTLGPLLARPGMTLRWTPGFADGDAKVGFTTGRWALHAKGDDGNDAIVETGSYCTVWRKQPDGRWKVMFDLGNDDRR